jgi:SAM-dependent methyltransferase
MNPVAESVLSSVGLLRFAKAAAWKYRLIRTARHIDLADLRFPGVRSVLGIEVGSMSRYQAYTRSLAAELQHRVDVEQSLVQQRQPMLLRGRDLLNHRKGLFFLDGPRAYGQAGTTRDVILRESLTCLKTQLNSRMRTVLVSLNRLIPARELARKEIYATEQNTSVYEFLRKRVPRLVGSEYLGPDVEPGSYRENVRHEDLTRLSFPDERFDVLLTLEVLEHIPDYQAALNEAYRVLRPGGLLVLSVPFEPERQKHLVRATLGPTGEIVHLLPPDYHVDPNSPAGGILCFRYFGWELLSELRAIGFQRVGALMNWDLDGALLGHDLLTFYAWK